MNDADRRATIERYEDRLRNYGYSPRTLGWGEHGRQEVRFAVLAEHALAHPGSSVLDVGCGFADLYDFLAARGWRGSYTGIDIVPGLLEVARERHPDLDLREADVTADGAGLAPHDFVIASGICNARLTSGDNRTHTVEVLGAMRRLARVAASIDFLSTHVDFAKPDAWHTDPGWALETAKRLTRRVALRHDYMPFEFTLTLFSDDAVGPRNVFAAFERVLG